MRRQVVRVIMRVDEDHAYVVYSERANASGYYQQSIKTPISWAQANYRRRKDLRQ
jgi:hypothetical protein